MSMAVRHQRLLSSYLINNTYFIIVHAGPDSNALYDTDPDLATLVTAKFANISEDTIVIGMHTCI